jgi:hypothetical protein
MGVSLLILGSCLQAYAEGGLCSAWGESPSQARKGFALLLGASVHGVCEEAQRLEYETLSHLYGSLRLCHDGNGVVLEVLLDSSIGRRASGVSRFSFVRIQVEASDQRSRHS